MTQAEFSNYLLFAALLAGLLGVVNLLRPHKRWLGGGAILLGLGTMLYRQGSPIPLVGTVCALAVGCMAKDVGSRTRRKA